MGGAGEALGTRLGHRDTGTPGRSGWPASMQIYWNKRKRLHKRRVQLPEDWFGTLHQHGRRFIVLGHQYGRRDVMWKHSIAIIYIYLNDMDIKLKQNKCDFLLYRLVEYAVCYFFVYTQWNCGCYCRLIFLKNCKNIEVWLGSDFATNSYGESRDSSCEKSRVPVQNQWIPVKKTSPKFNLPGPLCNQTVNVKTDFKTL